MRAYLSDLEHDASRCRVQGHHDEQLNGGDAEAGAASLTAAAPDQLQQRRHQTALPNTDNIII